MPSFDVGDWVVFWTTNWPSNVQVIQAQIGSPGSEDVTGEGLYMGRGQIEEVTAAGCLVREERSDQVTLVSTGERIEPMKRGEAGTLTLGDLRRFLAQHESAPDDVPVRISLPVSFNCDDERHRLPEGHPEAHEASFLHTVDACNIVFSGFEENSGANAFEYVPPDEHEPGDEWSYMIEIVLHPDEAHAALRRCTDE
jgi:hypothetical protein